MNNRLGIRPEDLDEASIFLYRIWAKMLLDEEPEALVLKEPEYVIIGANWALYCSRSPVNEDEVKLITSDTGKPVLCAAPKLSNELEGLDVESGTFHGNETNRRIVEGLARAAGELPLASKGRDPKVGRWVTTSQGKFEIWVGRQARLICVEQDCNEFGYSWDHKRPDLYFYHSKSCKREGKKSYSGTFKIAEQKREKGGPHLNIDLLTGMRDQAALLHLTPAGAGYKVFTRQLPKSFKPVSFFYSS